MVFVEYKKLGRIHKSRLKDGYVSVSKSYFAFDKQWFEDYIGSGRLIIFVDFDLNRIGFKSTEKADEERGFKRTKYSNNNSNAVYFTTNLVQKIQQKHYRLHFDEALGLYYINVLGIAIKKRIKDIYTTGKNNE